VHSFAGDDPIECKDYVRGRLGLPSWRLGDVRDRTIKAGRVKEWDADSCDAEANDRALTEDDFLRIERARALWDEAEAARGTIVEDYLKSRELKLTPGLDLKYHPRCPWRDKSAGRTILVPCMIAAFRSIDNDAIVGVHRVRLDQGPKPQRRMLGVVKRAAIKLAPSKDGAIAIGEGIETCLAAIELRGGKPAWALGSVDAISFFPVIDGIQRLTILAEDGEPSRNAIDICTRRWRHAGRRVWVAEPEVGTDANDELIALRRKGTTT
jgi:hypothetical protein